MPYEKFVKMIERHWDGITAFCKQENKVSLGVVESLNNKIRVIQRGSMDDEMKNIFALRFCPVCFRYLIKLTQFYPLCWDLTPNLKITLMN